MINLIKGQEVKGTQFVVLESGAFNHVDLVTVANVNNPDVGVCAFQANYIAIGENVGEEHEEQEMTKFQVRSIFTDLERIALDNYEDNPALNQEQKHVLKTIFADLDSVKDEVDVNSEKFQAALFVFKQFGLLSEEGLLRILNNV